jgi:signal transduction histidine kinase
MLRRHEYEDQLLHARRIAEESSAAKAKFLSMMSHDLRTPLTAIDGNAQLLAAGVHGPLADEQLEAVGAIREACRTQMTLIGDILEFARLDSGRVQLQTRAVLVSEIVARAETLVRFQVGEAGLRLTTEGCSGDTAVTADPNRLQQILLNLLTNAVKFTPPGGRITIVCESAGDRVAIRVEDTGIGISPEHLQRIFSPFVQVETAAVPAGHSAASRGVGLGLAISRDLARAMDGDVSAQSTPGAGSVFTIELPAAAALAPADAVGVDG